MQRIPIMKAMPGMTLARDIRRSDSVDGPPICGKGVELTWSLIERLKRMGIQTIAVAGNPVPEEGGKSVEQLIDDLDKRFRRVAEDPFAGKLKEIYRAYLTKTAGE